MSEAETGDCQAHAHGREFYFVWAENGIVRQLHYGTGPESSFRRISCSSLKIRHLPLFRPLTSLSNPWQCFLTSQAKATNLDTKIGPASFGYGGDVG